MKPVATLVILSLIFASAGFAQDRSLNAPTWSVLNSIAVGQSLQVDMKEGKSIKGRLDKISNAALELTVDGKAFSCQSDHIKRIYVLRERSIGRKTIIGAAVGAGGGAAFGAIVGRGDSWMFPHGYWTAVSAAVGLMIGAITGLALGSRQKKDLVYEATPIK
jgi:hypothetical protein